MSDTKGSTDGSFGERARYTFDDFTVDLARAELLHAGAGEPAAEVLRRAAYLIENRGRLATKDELERIYRDRGWQAYWRRRLELLNEAASQGYIEPYRFVEINVRLGDYDAAFAWLEKAFERRSSWTPTIAIDPLLDPLRADPRLTELMERARLRPPVSPLG
jgi:hypothetical protein